MEMETRCSMQAVSVMSSNLQPACQASIVDLRHSLGSRIATLRNEQCVAVADVAKALRLRVSVLRAVEAGQLDAPIDLDILSRLAAYFGVNPIDILGA
jgi:ribosome-binding protein aMBF1 (putative translation factor)